VTASRTQWLQRDGASSFSCRTVTLSGKLALPADRLRNCRGVISLGSSPSFRATARRTRSWQLGRQLHDDRQLEHGRRRLRIHADTIGIGNTALGYWALHYNTTGSTNHTAIGSTDSRRTDRSRTSPSVRTPQLHQQTSATSSSVTRVGSRLRQSASERGTHTTHSSRVSTAHR